MQYNGCNANHWNDALQCMQCKHPRAPWFYKGYACLLACLLCLFMLRILPNGNAVHCTDLEYMTWMEASTEFLKEGGMLCFLFSFLSVCEWVGWKYSAVQCNALGCKWNAVECIDLEYITWMEAQKELLKEGGMLAFFRFVFLSVWKLVVWKCNAVQCNALECKWNAVQRTDLE